MLHWLESIRYFLIISSKYKQIKKGGEVKKTYCLSTPPNCLRLPESRLVFALLVRAVVPVVLEAGRIARFHQYSG